MKHGEGNFVFAPAPASFYQQLYRAAGSASMILRRRAWGAAAATLFAGCCALGLLAAPGQQEHVLSARCSPQDKRCPGAALSQAKSSYILAAEQSSVCGR